MEKEIKEQNKNKFKVDKEIFETEKDKLTGREILTIAQKNPPENFILSMILKSGEPKTISLDQEISLLDKGIERFTSTQLDLTNG